MAECWTRLGPNPKVIATLQKANAFSLLPNISGPGWALRPRMRVKVRANVFYDLANSKIFTLYVLFVYCPS